MACELALYIVSDAHGISAMAFMPELNTIASYVAAGFQGFGQSVKSPDEVGAVVDMVIEIHVTPPGNQGCFCRSIYLPLRLLYGRAPDQRALAVQDGGWQD